MSKQKIFIAVSWPYANGELHLGHFAGQYVVSDVFSRFHRSLGSDVLMVSGSDFHGAPVMTKAEKAGLSYEEYANKSHQSNLDLYERMGLQYDCFTNTGTDNHKEISQTLFRTWLDFGFLIEKETEQYFDPKANRYLPDRFVKGTCPNCSNENARGDECPECGKFLEPEDLLEPYSTLSDATPILKKTKHFYIDLAKLQPELEKWFENDKDHWRKWVREITKGWFKVGLQARPITRDLSHGIPLPIEGWNDKVLYVWVEALIGYLSASIEWAEGTGKPSSWEFFWKDSQAKHYYFIAGGNVPFHTYLWPAELMIFNKKYESEELFDKYKLPGETIQKPLNLAWDVPANNMLLQNGKKMSKGDGVGVLMGELIDIYGADTLRYFLTKFAPESSDREYSNQDIIDSNNNDLVGVFGNFVNRTLVFTKKQLDGKVPDGTIDNDVQEVIDKVLKNTQEALSDCKFVRAIEEILEFGYFANKYFNDKEPWKAEDESKSNTLYNCFQIISVISTVLAPITPFATKKLDVWIGKQSLEWSYEVIEPGRVIGDFELMFEKLEE